MTTIKTDLLRDIIYGDPTWKFLDYTAGYKYYDGSSSAKQESCQKKTYISPEIYFSQNEDECQYRVSIPAIIKDTLKISIDPYERNINIDAEYLFDTLNKEKQKPSRFTGIYSVDKKWDIEQPSLCKYVDGVLYIHFKKNKKFYPQNIEVQFQ